MEPGVLLLAGLAVLGIVFFLKSLDTELLAGGLAGAGVIGSLAAVMLGFSGLTVWLPMAGGVGSAFLFAR